MMNLTKASRDSTTIVLTYKIQGVMRKQIVREVFRSYETPYAPEWGRAKPPTIPAYKQATERLAELRKANAEIIWHLSHEVPR